MKRIAMPLVLGFVGASYAFGADEAKLPGTYTLKDSESARVFAQALGARDQRVVLRLANDGSLTLEGSSLPRKGAYKFHNNRLLLTWDTATDALEANFRGDRIELGGMTFERLSPASLAGNWTSRSNGLEDPKIRMTFTKDGKFNFCCVGAKSSGTYTLEGDSLILSWTRIDDENVEPGAMKKTIKLNLEEQFFMIDRYRYERSTKG